MASGSGGGGGSYGYATAQSGLPGQGGRAAALEQPRSPAPRGVGGGDRYGYAVERPLPPALRVNGSASGNGAGGYGYDERLAPRGGGGGGDAAPDGYRARRSPSPAALRASARGGYPRVMRSRSPPRGRPGGYVAQRRSASPARHANRGGGGGGAYGYAERQRSPPRRAAGAGSERFSSTVGRLVASPHIVAYDATLVNDSTLAADDKLAQDDASFSAIMEAALQDRLRKDRGIGRAELDMQVRDAVLNPAGPAAV
ncbi:hypothetical protein JKP88DRAFT_325793 [Tribonema minus]|uniref:Uncharacterized protein n=1 Tax=Tribonema minus TaxID=303371 RepID=A0A835YQN4_9STRA|nr:hypothetical protein JKP88DRAFT_325793 [Tribonema minus]